MAAERVRAFVAVPLADEVRRAVAGFTDGLRRRVQGVKWVAPENLHLTLKFLGEVERPLIPSLESALDACGARFRPSRLRFQGMGVFPHPGRPRVVWVGLSRGGEAVGRLSEAVEDAMAGCGLPREAREFTPHLTVGRVKGRVRGLAALAAALEEETERIWGEQVLCEAHLVESRLFPTGPIYCILHRARLSQTAVPGGEEERE